jgi:hypothetical protein
MDIGIKEAVIAVVTTDVKRVLPGGASPVFYAKDKKELERISFLISKTTFGMVHEIAHETYIIVRH